MIPTAIPRLRLGRTLWLAVLLLVLKASVAVAQSLPKEQVLARVGQLKAVVDRKYWPGFNHPDYTLEMNYYEEGPYRMQLVQNGTDSIPRMECSSPEITFQAIPAVQSYEEWYAMLIHECFHAYQSRRYPQCWNRMVAATPQDFHANDSLLSLRNNCVWYNDMLTRENDLLLQMYRADSLHDVRRLFPAFMQLRQARLQRVKDELGLDIVQFYPLLESIEGSARYIEYCLYREQGIADTHWMFSLDGYYFYASGFYLILILDKHGIPYQDALFAQYHTLTDLLQARLR